jgi:hypothetical protein
MEKTMTNGNIQTIDCSSVVKKEIMSIDDFLQLPAVPHQRYTEGRAKTNKVKKMLGGHVRPEHLEIAIVELTEDCNYYGKNYKKGWRGIVNGNTRQLYWKEKLSKSIPNVVYATVYLCSDMEQVRDCYNTFDSMDATEIKKEKLYGILAGMYQYEPTSPKIIKGEFLSALNLACYYLYPDIFNSTNSKVESLPSQVGHYLEEIKVFDSICNSAKSWDQSLLCVALMSLKRYGTNNNKLLDCLDRIDRRAMNTNEKDRDGATHISYEWKTNERFPNKGTTWDRKGGMKEVVSFALYWIEKFMNDQKLSQLGYNWNNTGQTFFEDYKKSVLHAANKSKTNVVSINR